MTRKRPTGEPEARHRRAVAQTIQWAREAAEAGQYQDALSWMRVLETVEGKLPSEIVLLYDHCMAAVQTRAEAHDAERRHRLAA